MVPNPWEHWISRVKGRGWLGWFKWKELPYWAAFSDWNVWDPLRTWKTSKMVIHEHSSGTHVSTAEQLQLLSECFQEDQFYTVFTCSRESQTPLDFLTDKISKVKVGTQKGLSTFYINKDSKINICICKNSRTFEKHSCPDRKNRINCILWDIHHIVLISPYARIWEPKY